MEITHPRRILILSSPATTLSSLINTLVPPRETPNGKSTVLQDRAGHDLEDDDAPIHHIQTTYYSARVPIWTDRIEASEAWAEDWKAQDGASEVVRAVGAWIVAFEKPASAAEEQSIRTLLTHVSSVLAHHSTESYDLSDPSDAILLAVALPSSTASNYAFSAEAWDDYCQECGGWELIDGEMDGRKNQYGEITGFPRLIQALQAGEWDAGGEDLDDMLGLDDGEGTEGGEESEEMRQPILSESETTGGTAKSRDKDMKEAEEEDDLDDDDVEELQRMMVRLQAARDMGADLPIGERRKLAARAVREVMRGSRG